MEAVFSKADNEQEMLAVASQMIDVRACVIIRPVHTLASCKPSMLLACPSASFPVCQICDQTCDQLCALQTLNHMHMDGKVCHLDITPGNIMLQSKPANPWDAVRFIDFGFGTKV